MRKVYFSADLLLASLLLLATAQPVQGAVSDLRLTVITDKQVYSAGEPVSITIHLTNLGPETVTLHFSSACQYSYRVEDLLSTVLYDLRRRLVCGQVLTELTLLSGQTATHSFTGIFAWNQVDDAGNPVPVPGDYVVRGVMLSAEPAPTGVTKVRIVKLMGDVNYDCTVDVLDLVTVGAAFMATPTSANWNPNADVNKDGIVNILDLVIVGSSFLKKVC